jgi:RinA family phage transcriptional activator
LQKITNQEYKRKVLSLLEMEVKLYQQTKKALDEEIITAIWERSAPEDGLPARSNRTGDPTAKKAIQIYSSAVIGELDKRVRAIERAMEEFCAKDAERRRAFIRLRFWDSRYTNTGIAMKLSVGEATVRRWRSELLVLVAMYLGWRLTP